MTSIPARTTPRSAPRWRARTAWIWRSSRSSRSGIEFAGARRGGELLDAYHEGALELPEPFGAWAAGA